MGVPSAGTRDTIHFMSGAKVEYNRRLEMQKQSAKTLSRYDLLLSQLRGVLFVAFIVLLFASFNEVTSYYWITIPVVVFGVVAVLHERVIGMRDDANRIVLFYQRGISRLEGTWMGGGTPGTEFLDSSHPYSEDLDLFGKGSLFELLSIARTQAGEKMLAQWLLSGADPGVIRERQDGIKDLCSRLDYREDLAVKGGKIRGSLRPESLLAWAEQDIVIFTRWMRFAAVAAVTASIATLAGWALAFWGPNPFVAAIAVHVLVMRKLGNQIRHITKGAEGAHPDLKLLSLMLDRIEREQFESEYLRNLQLKLRTGSLAPSQQTARMGRLLELLDWQRNQLFAPLAILLMWEVQIAFALEAWREKCGRRIRYWIEVVAEMEALSSLSCFAFENPHYPFPEITHGPCFEAEELGHPLIPGDRCVRNSIRMNPVLRMKIISGSNMSGKSTLLRTVGVNAVLALCGAPVRAEKLRLSPLSIGASIHILDSLQTGSSRFYAEITRLRQIMDLTRKQLPVLFLLDEILNGTNSADRLTGAEAIIRSFLQSGAIGLLTTHDLALTQIAAKHGQAVENVHFQDHIENGRIAFDYRVHPGVVQKSNAIALMRAVGLDV